MAAKHPYISTVGGLVQAIEQFRKNFPSKVDLSTIEKLGFAPNNERFVISIFRFLDLLDKEGNKTQRAAAIFNNHKDEDFQDAFSDVVRTSYADLFELHGEEAWKLDDDSLIGFFRSSDSTSAVTGKRQANTFVTLAALSGERGQVPKVDTTTRAPKKAVKKPATKNATDKKQDQSDHEINNGRMGDSSHSTPKNSPDLALTVRVEVNLPTDGKQETYDRIFKSIRENLIQNG